MVCCEPVAISPEACVSPRRQRAEHQRNAAVGVEEIGQRVGDILLVDVEPAGGNEIEREIEIGVGGVVAQGGLNSGQVGIDQRAEGAADAAAAVRIVYCLAI